MTIHVDVTEDDILDGQRGSSNFCPVALALNRALNVESAAVGGRFITFWKGYHFYHHRIPNELTEWVKNFDAANPVDPFTMELVIGDGYTW